MAAGGGQHRREIFVRRGGGNTPGQGTGTSRNGLIATLRHGVCNYFLPIIIGSDHLCSLR